MTDTVTLEPRGGSHLLYQQASPLERATADVDFEHMVGIPAELVKAVWDPYGIPLPLLPYLAWAMGVNFWNDQWSEQTKRDWVARQWEFKSKRGTIDGVIMALDFAGRDVSPFGYKLRGYITQPQTYFMGPSLTKEQREAWLAELPQVRVYTFIEPGFASPYKYFVGPQFRVRSIPSP